MVQKDYIMRMIEQFAVILMKIVFNKENGNFDTALIEIDNAYRNLTGWTPQQIKSMNELEILQELSADNYLDIDRCIVIAELLCQEAEIKEMQKVHDESITLLIKSLYLFLYAIQDSSLYYQKKYTAKVDDLIEKLADYELPNHFSLALFQFFEITARYGKAEDKLYELIEIEYANIQRIAVNFYNRLLLKSDVELERGNLARDEVEEGLKQLELFKI